VKLKTAPASKVSWLLVRQLTHCAILEVQVAANNVPYIPSSAKPFCSNMPLTSLHRKKHLNKQSQLTSLVELLSTFFVHFLIKA